MPVAFIRVLLLLFTVVVWTQAAAPSLCAQTPPTAADRPRFDVRSYVAEGRVTLPTNSLAAIFSKHIGTNIDLAEIVGIAADLQQLCREQGFPSISVAVAEKRITNGVVPFYVFQSGTPQILVSGKRYYSSREKPPIENIPAKETPEEYAKTNPTAVTNSPPPPAETATKTNSGPQFAVLSYLIMGNTLLRPETLKAVLWKHTGSNLVVSDILKAGSELQMEYRARGYPTVNVTIPPQQITNGTVKLRVFEGRLSDVQIVHNHYFSSNNIMKALPSLHADMMLNGPIFQAELNRANANQDRQIYPKLQPGPEENTTTLSLEVKDRLPLHAKVELNNQNSPGTPDLRVNSSAVYNNLWQAEHSLGVQYSFAPERYKTGEQWNFYDQPMVANYSAFYRMPLSSPESLAEVVEANPGSFGYSEATRKFTPPPPSGQPEVSFFASRATIDTGIMTLSDRVITNIPGALLVSEKDVQQDLTVNQDLGSRLTVPFRGNENFQSGITGGVDYKTYDLLSTKTNNFFFSIITVNPNGTTNPPVTSQVASPVPTTHKPLQYLPLSVHYDATLRDARGATTFGLGVNGNVWHSGTRSNLQDVTGSTKSTGHWVTLTPSISRDFSIYTNWILTVRADGQWASEPLISNEQFGAGGVFSVHGYHEGEVFGDTGWHVGLEQKTPPHIVGYFSPGNPLTVRGSFFMDYAETYLLDPQGRPGSTGLWGTGLGAVVSFGPHWESRFLFSMPLLSAGTISRYEPLFGFSLVGQF